MLRMTKLRQQISHILVKIPQMKHITQQQLMGRGWENPTNSIRAPLKHYRFFGGCEVTHEVMHILHNARDLSRYYAEKSRGRAQVAICSKVRDMTGRLKNWIINTP